MCADATALTKRDCAEAKNATGLSLEYASYQERFFVILLKVSQSTCLLSKLVGDYRGWVRPAVGHAHGRAPSSEV